MRFMIVIILMLGLISAASGLQSKEITAHTGDPVLYDKGGAPVMRTFSEQEYQKQVADRQAKQAPIVPIKQKPENLPDGVRYGFTSHNGQDVGWMIVGDDASGYKMYVDFNANGDLSDERPQQFDKVDDKYSVILKTTGKSKDGQSYPVVRR